MYKLFLIYIKNFTALIFVQFALCANCTHIVKENKDNGVREIDVMTNLSKSSKVNLSEIASSIDYCILETDEKCLVSPQMSVYCSTEYIVAIGSQSVNNDVCYVFERNTGNFIRQISNTGQGPGEYQEIINSFWDEKN